MVFGNFRKNVKIFLRAKVTDILKCILPLCVGNFRLGKLFFLRELRFVLKSFRRDLVRIIGELALERCFINF